jgi:hypothetical protein
MKFIKHRACGTEVVVRREDGAYRIWCPRCEIVVKDRDLNKRGPYSLVLPEDTQEAE